jgi:hypothetical protein
MLTAIFGDIQSGRLQRLPYLGMSQLTGPQMAGVLNLAVFLALLLIPSSALGHQGGATKA